MMIQLNPALPVCCPKGNGLAHFLIDYGIESNLCWVIFMDETNEIWCYENPLVRAQKNITAGRENNATEERK